LRRDCKELISLVALDADRVVGHILFSPATIYHDEGSVLRGMGLAPMAVLPEFRSKGVGSALVREGLARLRGMKCPFVIVLGHPGFYPRFGFERASKFGVACQWPGIPDEVFMMILIDGSLAGRVSGTGRYRDEFNEAM
jgi:putative acetyltransferase